jgi:hypothetical protein
MSDSFIKHYLDDALTTFRNYKKMGEKAFGQVSDEEFFRALDEESNSIAVIIKHIAGNMISRWTDFLTSDGEKPDRHRDMEFIITPETNREEMIRYWERGWACLFGALEPLRPEDFEKKVYIRAEEHTIVQAINRQLAHYAYHVGQIVFLAKHLKSSEWKTLSIPRNKSAVYNAHLAEKPGEPGAGPRQKNFDAIQEFIQETENKGEK